MSSPAVMAAREFAAQPARWLASAVTERPSPIQALIHPLSTEWMFVPLDTDKVNDRVEKRRLAWAAINRELQDLEDQLREDRDRYLAEAATQSDGLTDYFLHFLGIDPASKPWTVQLLRCGAAIGHVMVMQYKATYKRVRPSTLCPGLVPPWGPPQHPSFPSGHSLVAHLYALLLLEIEPVHQRFGIQDGLSNPLRKPRWSDFFDRPVNEPNDGFSVDGKSPLLWLAWRAARNRERIGLHYRSDSAASRRLAAGLWLAMLGSEADRAALAAARGLAKFEPVNVPSLHTVLSKARAEWPSMAWAEPACAPAPEEPKAEQNRSSQLALKSVQAGK